MRALFLDLIIDEHLSRDEHADHILGKINSGIYVLKRLFHLCNLNILMCVFHAQIQSHYYLMASVFLGKHPIA